jgi:hypothetical protein
MYHAVIQTASHLARCHALRDHTAIALPRRKTHPRASLRQWPGFYSRRGHEHMLHTVREVLERGCVGAWRVTSPRSAATNS